MANNIFKHIWNRPISWALASAVCLAAAVLAAGCIFETREDPPILLFLGNSITKSDTNSSYGWNITAGMAATKVENDYVHRTLEILKRNGMEMKGVLGARDCDTLGCDGPIEEHLNNIRDLGRLKPRYVVVQLGENSNDFEVMGGKLRMQYRALLEAISRAGVRRIFCISPWGETSLSRPRAKAVALAMQGIEGAELVDITAISADPTSAGDPEIFADPDVLWHPGDRGMDRIARALADAIMKEP